MKPVFGAFRMSSRHCLTGCRTASGCQHQKKPSAWSSVPGCENPSSRGCRRHVQEMGLENGYNERAFFQDGMADSFFMDDKKGKGEMAFHGTAVCICTAGFGGMEAMMACVEVDVCVCLLHAGADCHAAGWSPAAAVMAGQAAAEVQPAGCSDEDCQPACCLQPQLAAIPTRTISDRQHSEVSILCETPYCIAHRQLRR